MISLDLPRKSLGGVSERKTKEQLYKQTKDQKFLIPELEIPAGGERAWLVFWELFDGKGISYGEIASFVGLTGMQLKSWEVKAIKKMDIAAQNLQVEILERESKCQ